jgi:hypothetical protein
MSTVSIADIVNRYDLPDTDARALTQALVDREQAMVDVLHQAGMQFGLFPQIVAEVLAQVEMGEPIPTEQRALIHSQFHVLMEQIAMAQRGEGPMPTP